MRLWRGFAVVVVLAMSASGCAWISRVSESSGREAADVETPTSSPPAISADGRYVAFDSFGALAPNAPDGGIFVRDTRAGVTAAVSIRTNGTVDDFAETPAISGDGRFVAFVSDDPDLVPDARDDYTQVYVRDRVTGTTTRVSSRTNGTPGIDDSDRPALSHDGGYIAFESDSPGFVAGDTNDWTDVFVRNRVSGTTRRVSLDVSGAEVDTGGNDPSMSASGRFVTFTSFDPLTGTDRNTVDDVFVRDLLTNTTTLVSASGIGFSGNGPSTTGRISADGRYVTFLSSATNLDGLGDGNRGPDVFVRDLVARTTRRVSLARTGGWADGWSSAPSISGDGRFVTYASTAADLVAGDTNGVVDTFVFDRSTATTLRTSTDQFGTQLPAGGTYPLVSADGRSVLFATRSPISGTSPTTIGQLYVRSTLPSAEPR
jgi:Tol biopolymer transport system component